MKKEIQLFLLISLLSAPFYASAASMDPLLYSKEDPGRIVIYPRILAKVNGKPISVLDIAKKMDVLFYRQYPQYINFPAARIQFYQANWKQILQEMIDKEIIIADATDNKVTVSQGDVRQELESTFGPDVIGNLDQMGLSYEEASKMMLEELLIRRMLMARVQAKVIRGITPQDVRNEYVEYAKKNILPAEWQYRVVTIRDADPAKSAEVSLHIQHLLKEEQVSLDQLVAALEKQNLLTTSTKVTVSELFKHTEKELSPSYKEVLGQLQPGTYSNPLAQKSRADRTVVTRIYYLAGKRQEGALPFVDVETSLRNELIDTGVTAETKTYIERLRKHYGVKENDIKIMVPDDFEPFALVR